MTTLKEVLHTIADKVRHADETERANLHKAIDELADEVEKGADYVDWPAAGDTGDQDPAAPVDPSVPPAATS